MCSYFLFFKQKTAYEMRISDWSSDVCSSDLEYDEFPKLMLSLRILAIEQYERLSCIAANSFSSSRSRVINSKRFSGRKGSMNREAIFEDRKSVVKGKSVSVRVDIGGRRIITKKTNNIIKKQHSKTKQK